MYILFLSQKDFKPVLPLKTLYENRKYNSQNLQILFQLTNLVDKPGQKKKTAARVTWRSPRLWRAGSTPGAPEGRQARSASFLSFCSTASSQETSAWSAQRQGPGQNCLENAANAKRADMCFRQTRNVAAGRKVVCRKSAFQSDFLGGSCFVPNLCSVHVAKGFFASQGDGKTLDVYLEPRVGPRLGDDASVLVADLVGVGHAPQGLHGQLVGGRVAGIEHLVIEGTAV